MPIPTSTDPEAEKRKELAAFLVTQQERRKETLEKRQEKSAARDAVHQASEVLVQAEMEKESRFEEEHENRLRAFKKAEDERKKQVAEFQRKKREEEQRMLDRKKKDAEETEKRHQYMQDMHKASVLTMRKDLRNRKAEETGQLLRAQADRDAFMTKQQLERTEHQQERTLTLQSMKARGDADAEEQRLLMELQDDTRRAKAKLDLQERTERTHIEQEMAQRPDTAAQGRMALRILDSKFQKQRTDVEVNLRKRSSEIRAQMQKKRSAAIQTERAEKARLEAQTREGKRQADVQAGQKKTAAAEKVVEIRRDTKTGEEIK